jgi:glycosyltransferase involved in cell wall biosynthesis
MTGSETAMSDNLVFSIVTPSYNQGEFLAQTIESVLSQAGDFAIDYLIVDGGSQDDSLEIIKKYQALLESGNWPLACRDIRYRWLSEKDAGQTDALMKGFDRAEGSILAWLNSDDTYLPGALQSAARFFEAEPQVALVYGAAYYCDPAGTVIGRYRTDAFDLDKLAYFNIICQPSAFFRREAFQAVGGLDRSLSFAMDFDLWIRIAKRFPCRYLPDYFSSYRLHETSKTVREETLYENSEEALRLTLKYFDWAPLTRVYNSCNFYCRARLPRFLARNRLTLMLASVSLSLLRSLWLNRGIRLKDLALLNRDNFGKLFKSRLEIMTGSKETHTDCKRAL